MKSVFVPAAPSLASQVVTSEAHISQQSPIVPSGDGSPGGDANLPPDLESILAQLDYLLGRGHSARTGPHWGSLRALLASGLHDGTPLDELLASDKVVALLEFLRRDQLPFSGSLLSPTDTAVLLAALDAQRTLRPPAWSTHWRTLETNS